MKYYELTKQEKQLVEDFESDKLEQVADIDKKRKLYQKYAKNTLAKSRNINIRLPERTVSKLKKQAAQKGIPYQTYAASLLHQSV